MKVNFYKKNTIFLIKVLTFKMNVCYNLITDCDKTVGYGALAQLGERHVCTVEVSGSIPLCSTILKLKELKKSSFFV